MTAWSQLETLCRSLFTDFLNVDRELTTIVFDRIGTREQIEIISEIAELIKDDKLREEIVQLMDSVQKISVKRNKIVHARWGLLDMIPARLWYGITDIQFREIVLDTDKGKSARATRIFNLHEIVELTQQCVTLRDELFNALSTLKGIHLAPLSQGDVRISDLLARRHGALRER